MIRLLLALALLSLVSCQKVTRTLALSEEAQDKPQYTVKLDPNHERKSK